MDGASERACRRRPWPGGGYRQRKLHVHRADQYPETVEVRMFIGSPGPSSFESYYELWIGARKHAEGAAKIVWMDRATLRSTPLPDAVRGLFR